jgi:hypothetical protein
MNSPIDRKRRPKRVYSGVGLAAGCLLLWFELSRLHRTGPEGWFWIAVATLMMILGLVGLFQREDNGADEA